MLPIERGQAILLITEIPARVCANCGEPYLAEGTAEGIQALANERFNGTVSYSKTRGEQTVLVAAFS